MSSKSTYVAAWLATTAVAATVAWQSLGFVDADTDTGADAFGASAAESAEGPPPTSTPASEPVVVDSIPASSMTGAAGSGTSTTVAATTSTAGQAIEPQTVEQVVELIGGTVAIRFSPDSIEVLWATPAPGFRAESDDHGSRVEVEFKGGGHESKLRAWWDGGPRFSTSEERES